MAGADLCIAWGAREIMSMVGILITFASSWYYGRKWDEEGALVYDTIGEEPAGGDYNIVDEDGQPKKKFVTNADGSRDAISVSTEDAREASVPVPAQAFENAMPIPYGMIVGLGIWTISFLFKPAGTASSYGRRVYTGSNLVFLLFLPAVTVLLAFHIRKTTIERNLEYKKLALSMVLAMSVFLVIAGIADQQTDAPWYCCVFGALFLFVSYHIMRRSRKMGISWEMEGKPSSDVTAHNFGAVTLILAGYLIWIGTNAIFLDGFLDVYVPIYLGYRAWFAFFAAFFIMIPSTVALDFAFAQGAAPIPLAFGIYKLDGKACRGLVESLSPPRKNMGLLGEYMETPWPLLCGWFLFGLSSFMPFGNGLSFQNTITFLICCAVGTIYATRLLPAYWNREVEYKKWTYAYRAGMVCLMVAIGVGGQGALIPSMLGGIFIVLGHHIDMSEKKKGNHWIEQGVEKPQPEVVYGLGHPIHVIGWLLLCLGMSIPTM